MRFCLKEAGIWDWTLNVTLWLLFVCSNTCPTTLLERKHVWDMLEVCSWDTMGVNLTKIFSIQGYRDGSGHCLTWQDFQWREGTPTLPQRLWPWIYPVYKMCMDKGGADNEGTVNQWLTQLEAHPHEESQLLTLLMILCHVCRKENVIAVAWEAALCFRD